MVDRQVGAQGANLREKILVTLKGCGELEGMVFFSQHLHAGCAWMGNNGQVKDLMQPK